MSAPEQSGAAAAAAGEPFDAKELIGHHINDSQTLELPFGYELHLPTLHLFGYDLKVTKYVVMMWIASALLLLIAWLATRRRSLVPRGVHNVMEAVVVFVRDELARKHIGHEGDRYVSYLLSSFMFILKSVLIGVVLSVPLALFISVIDVLVAFLQAYIFTMLTSLFIGMSVHPQH